jgi:MFS family permease
MGYFVSSFTLAALIGPAIGGFLTDAGGWRWCFYINVPVCVGALVLISANLPATGRGGRLGDVDFAGAGLLAVATITMLLALAWSNEEMGWTSPATIGLLCTSAVFWAAFVVQESRHPAAILPISLMRRPIMVQTNLLAALQSGGMFGAMQYLPTFIQVSLGASATSSGLVSTPQSLALFVASIFGGRLVAGTGRFKKQLVFGGVLTALGALLLARIGVHTPEWEIAALVVLVGFGGGLVGPTGSVVVQACVTHDQIGVATGGRQFFNQIGQVLGVALFGLLFTTTYTASFSSSLAPADHAAIGDTAYHAMQDPTRALDRTSFASIRDAILSRPDGERLLDATLTAQKSAAAEAIDRIFLGATAAGVAMVMISLVLREFPLHDRFAVARNEEEPVFTMVH